MRDVKNTADDFRKRIADVDELVKKGVGIAEACVQLGHGRTAYYSWKKSLNSTIPDLSSRVKRAYVRKNKPQLVTLNVASNSDDKVTILMGSAKLIKELLTHV